MSFFIKKNISFAKFAELSYILLFWSLIVSEWVGWLLLRALKDNLFIKLLITMEKKSFNYKELKQMKEYNALKENYPHQIMHESEIIFYDILWEILLDIIKKNDQKLISTIR